MTVAESILKNNLLLLLFVVITAIIFFVLSGIFGKDFVPKDVKVKIEALTTENKKLKANNEALTNVITDYDRRNREHMQRDSEIQVLLLKNTDKLDSIQHRKVRDVSRLGSDELRKYFSDLK